MKSSISLSKDSNNLQVRVWSFELRKAGFIGSSGRTIPKSVRNQSAKIS